MPAPSITADLGRTAWDSCAGDENPFVSHGFYTALEHSGSAVPSAGWVPQPLCVRDAEGQPLGIAPVYQKTHSWGEYVFDQPWAQAWQRAGGRYYPKLFVGVPFTPVPGPRLLVRTDAPADTRDRLITAIEQATRGFSSAHVTFIEEADRAAFKARGWVLRAGYQFHFQNPGFVDFEAFLATLQSHRRKDIRRERRLAQGCGLSLKTLVGNAITEEKWAQFHTLYVANSDRKWGQAYLTPTFFAEMGAALGDRVILTVALDGETMVAGALHLRGKNALYGRNWGASRQIPFLHFELCYYMALDLAFREGIGRIEAGAQGEHKLQRGYLPSLTWSAHYLPDPGFRRAVEAFCTEERQRVEAGISGIDGPFRAGSDA